VSSDTVTSLRLQGPPADVTRLLTAAAAPTAARYPDADGFHYGPVWRVLHNLYPVPADVLTRRWGEAGGDWPAKHWAVWPRSFFGSIAVDAPTRRAGGEAVLTMVISPGPPRPWVAKVAADFPQLTFEHRYVDAQDFFGRDRYRRGRRVDGWRTDEPQVRHAGAADVLIECGYPPDAVPLLDRLIRKHPTDARLYVLRARANRGADDEDHDDGCDPTMSVVPDLERATALEPRLAEAHVERAGFLRERGAVTEARAALDAAVRADPGWARAYRERAAARRPDDPRGALRDVNRALRLDPHDATAYLFRGVLRLDADRVPAALADLRRAVTLDPCHGPAYYHRAIALLTAQHYPAALADFDQAAFWRPQYAQLAEYVLHRGKCLEGLGH
jgi:tetratricopeptide (TPR) repeat protein